MERLELPQTSAYPSDDEWSVILATGDQGCKPLAERYLGGPIDPHGKFRLSGIVPSPAYWARGNRRVWCALTGAPEAETVLKDGPVATQGSARGQSQALLYAVGTCFGAPESQELSRVPCDTPHALEIAGTVDVRGRTQDRPSSPAEWARVLGTDCRMLAEQYLGRSVDERRVATTFLNLRQESWDAGRRDVQCLVGLYDGEGNNVALKDCSVIMSGEFRVSTAAFCGS